PLSVPALSAACGGSCGALLLLRALLRPRKRQTAAPAPLRLFLPQAAPQLRSPPRVGGPPLRRFAPALPQGELSVRSWTHITFLVRQSKTASSVVTIQQKEPFLCPLRLAPLDSSPARVGAKTYPLGSASHVYGTAQLRRCLRQKQPKRS